MLVEDGASSIIPVAAPSSSVSNSNNTSNNNSNTGYGLGSMATSSNLLSNTTLSFSSKDGAAGTVTYSDLSRFLQSAAPASAAPGTGRAGL